MVRLTVHPGAAGNPGPGRLPVRNRPLSAQVADALRDMVLTGALAPGQTLTQDALAELLSVSTMPVREALLRLSHEGLVEARRNRSFAVARTTRQDVEDVYATHAHLAGELTARAARHATPELLDELAAVEEAWPEADTPALEELNWRFHRAVNRAADAPKLLLFLRNTIRFIPDHFYALLPEWRSLSQKGHRQMARAIARGDEDRARAAAQGHVRDAGRLLIAHFNETGYWSRPAAGPGPGPGTAGNRK